MKQKCLSLLAGSIAFSGKHRLTLIPALAAASLSLSATAPALTYVWRTFVGGTGSPGSENSPGIQAMFYHPEGITIDSMGNLYLADRSNHAIRKITPEGITTTLAGAGGLAGSTNGTGSAARFSQPSGISIDSGGNLYVADTLNHMIRKITPVGVVTTLAGQIQAGSTDGAGNIAKFSSPAGVVLDPEGNVFVTDSFNHTIRKITPAGVVSTLAGMAGQQGSTDGSAEVARFRNPTGIAIDPGGNLYVTEFNNHTLRKITPAGVVSTLAGLAGTSGASTGAGSNARFYSPTGVAVAADGSLFVADHYNNMIRRVTQAGGVTNFVGTAGTEGAQEGLGAAARFDRPHGIALDAGGNLYVSDRDNAIIRKVSPGAFVANFAGIPSGEGHADSPGVAARFNSPRGPSFDADGNLYVADSGNHTIRKISRAGVVTTIAGLAGSSGSTDGTGAAARFSSPLDTAIAGNGWIYVSDHANHTIRRITSGNVVTTIAGSPGLTGTANGSGLAARFSAPRGITIDSSGLVYVADGNNHSIRKMEPSGFVSTLAGVPGVQGSGNGAAGSATFRTPHGIAAASTGQLFIADHGNHLMRATTVTGGTVSTEAGLSGTEGFQDGTGSGARMKSPTDMAASPSGAVFFTDTGNHTVRMLSGGTVTTIGGKAGLSGTDEGLSLTARFSSPDGVTAGPDGIYITDSGNHRIVRGVPYGTPYQAWLAFHSLTSTPGDADKDGLENLLEFAFGTHPRDPRLSVASAEGGTVLSHGTPVVLLDGSRRVVYARRLDRFSSGLTYTPQFSHDLSDWHDYTGFTISQGSDGEVELISVPFPTTLPNSHVPRFFRLLVAVP